VAALRPAARQHFTAVFVGHTRAETVLVRSLSLRWLIRPFHVGSSLMNITLLKKWRKGMAFEHIFKDL
jgi:hypothetical protein